MSYSPQPTSAIHPASEDLPVVPTHGGGSRIRPTRQQEIPHGMGQVVNAAGRSFTMGYATVAVAAARL